MIESEETKTTPGADVQPPAKEPYVKPQIEVIELETEQPVLAGSGASNSPWSPDTW